MIRDYISVELERKEGEKKKMLCSFLPKIVRLGSEIGIFKIKTIIIFY